MVQLSHTRHTVFETRVGIADRDLAGQEDGKMARTKRGEYGSRKRVS